MIFTSFLAGKYTFLFSLHKISDIKNKDSWQDSPLSMYLPSCSLHDLFLCFCITLTCLNAPFPCLVIKLITQQSVILNNGTNAIIKDFIFFQVEREKGLWGFCGAIRIFLSPHNHAFDPRAFMGPLLSLSLICSVGLKAILWQK